METDGNRDMVEKLPASIRSCNPGAQWPGPSSRRFNAVRSEALNDGLGQGNKIAIFENHIDGAAALFDLWDRVYTNLKLKSAIKKWSGGNSVQSYLDVFVERANIPPDLIITKEMIRHPDFGVRFAKAMAWHEAGQEYPLTDEEWRQAQALAFLASPPVKLPSKTEAKKVLAKSSKKYSVAGWYQAVLAFFGVGVPASWQGVKATVGVSQDVVQTVTSAVSTYGAEAVAGVCIVGAIGFNWMRGRMVEDVEAGRAVPSGEEEK